MRKRIIAGSTGLLLAIPATAAVARDDRVEVSRNGQCSGAATWQLTAKERDGGVELEFEVDSNSVGQTWQYTVSGPSGVIRSGQAVTSAPSGSFSVEVAAAGSATDAFAARASHAGQTCDTGSAGPGPSDTTAPTPEPEPTNTAPTPGAQPTGPADGGDDGPRTARKRIRRTGVCSASSEIELKVKRRARLRIVELEVDSDRAGQRWSYRIKRGSTTVSEGTARTTGRSGSFTVKARVRGGGRITARTKNRSGGETCAVRR